MPFRKQFIEIVSVYMCLLLLIFLLTVFYTTLSRCHKGAVAKYPCDYCFAKAVPTPAKRGIPCETPFKFPLKTKKPSKATKKPIKVAAKKPSKFAAKKPNKATATTKKVSKADEMKAAKAKKAKKAVAAAKAKKDAAAAKAKEPKPPRAPKPVQVFPKFGAGEPRTRETTKAILKDPLFKPLGNEDEHLDVCKGVAGESVFLDHPGFDYIKSIPAEYMHLVCLGLVKKLFELTFAVGQNRVRCFSYLRVPVKELDRLLLKQRVCSEMSRKTRRINFPNLKAEEHKYFILVFFPLILEAIPDSRPQEKQMWRLLGYLMRAYNLPQEEFDNLDKRDLYNIAKRYHNLYRKQFGQINMVYSLHLLCHLDVIRGDTPLCTRSAFKFEGFFSEMMTSFSPGTTNTGKQIVQNTFLRKLEPHRCAKKLKFSASTTSSKTRDNMVYVFNKAHRTYDFYQIDQIGEKDELICHQIVSARNVDEDAKLDFGLVGVHTNGGHLPDIVTIRPEDVSGKALMVVNHLVAIPTCILIE
jgi:hypothetical protein